MRRATSRLIEQLGNELSESDLEKYVRIPLQATDTHPWYHVWGSLYPLISNFEVNVPIAFGDSVSNDFDEEVVKNLAKDVLASREIRGNNMHTWGFVTHVMKYVKASTRTRPSMGPGAEFVKDQFGTLLLLAPYLQNPSRCIIKALTSLPASGVRLMREKGVVPWSDDNAAVLHRAFGRKTHGVLPFNFKAHVDGEKVKRGLLTVQWALQQTTLLAITFRHLMGHVPDTYYFGSRLEPTGPNQAPAADNVQEDDVEDDDDSDSPVRVTGVTHLWVNLGQ